MQRRSNTMMKTLRGLAASAALALGCMSATSVTAELTAQTPTPRPTPAEFHGSNYFVSTTLGISNALSLLTASGVGIDGTFNPMQVRAEISTMSKAGINSIRIFPSFYGWLISPADYMRNLKELARICRSRGVVITYVMWNTTSNVFAPMYWAVTPGTNAYDAQLHNTVMQVASAYTLNASPTPYPVVLSFGEPWQMVLHDEPSNSLFMAPYDGVMATWPNGLKQKCEAYVDAIGQFFATDPDGQAAYGSYDLFNEPDCCNVPLQNTLELLSVTHKRLARQHFATGAPTPEFTIGFAQYNRTRVHHDQMTAGGVKQTYLSFHCYEGPQVFPQVVAQNAAVGVQLGLPVLCSEFYDRNKPGHLGALGTFLNALDAHGVSGNVWGYLATNLIVPASSQPPGTFLRLDGMVIPSAVPFTSFSSPLFFSMAPGSIADARALRVW